MKKILCLLFIFGWITSLAMADSSLVVTVDGTASLGDDRTRKETISAAKVDAKRNAAEQASTYILSETQVKDYVTEKDLVEAYSQAIVKIIETIAGQWFQDDVAGESYRITIKAEIIPQLEKVKALLANPALNDDPRAPLKAQIWSDHTRYQQGDTIKLYMKANKPFYARVVYKDAEGQLVQLLPNPYRRENYFNGGTIYELPTGRDTYELEITPPYGQEEIMLFASTLPLGDVDLADAGSVYQVNESTNSLSNRSRGIKFTSKDPNKTKLKTSEFFEAKLTIHSSAR
jgi:uncharacterized protein DUF4384